MTDALSKTQIDRLGDRLRVGNINEEDLRVLDTYRRSFADAYETVVGIVRDQLALEPTGRPAKSTTSITEKLKRASIRLSQMQDIAGCRLIVADRKTQAALVERLRTALAMAAVVDRREHPSHGYRAVHVIATEGDRIVEVQIRTALQHLWAELSEKLSDVLDPAIKYGGGPEGLRSLLERMSWFVSSFELEEQRLQEALANAPPEAEWTDAVRQAVTQARDQLESSKQKVVGLVEELITMLRPGPAGGERAIPD